MVIILSIHPIHINFLDSDATESRSSMVTGDLGYIRNGIATLIQELQVISNLAHTTVSGS